MHNESDIMLEGVDFWLCQFTTWEAKNSQLVISDSDSLIRTCHLSYGITGRCCLFGRYLP